VAKKGQADLPIAPLPDLIRWWQDQNTPAVVIGGLAIALLGRPRVTRDIDALVLLPEDRWPAFLAAGSEFVSCRGSPMHLPSHGKLASCSSDID
jgi:hypothetical protein